MLSNSTKSKKSWSRIRLWIGCETESRLFGLFPSGKIFPTHSFHRSLLKPTSPYFSFFSPSFSFSFFPLFLFPFLPLFSFPRTVFTAPSSNPLLQLFSPTFHFLIVVGALSLIFALSHIISAHLSSIQFPIFTFSIFKRSPQCWSFEAVGHFNSGVIKLYQTPQWCSVSEIISVC